MVAAQVVALAVLVMAPAVIAAPAAAWTVSGDSPVLVGTTHSYTASRTGCSSPTLTWSVAGKNPNPGTASIVGSTTANPVSISFTGAGVVTVSVVVTAATVTTPGTSCAPGTGSLDVTVNKHGTSLTESLGTGTITYGQTVAISGDLTDTSTSTSISGATVTLSIQSTSNGTCGGSSSGSDTTTTDGTGHYSKTYRPINATPPGGRDVKAAAFASDATYTPASACQTPLVVNKAPTAVVDQALTDTSITTAETTILDYKVQSAYGVAGKNTAGTVSVVKNTGSGILSCTATSTLVAAAQSNADGSGAADAGFSFPVNSVSNTSYRFTCSADAADTYTFHVHYTGDSDYTASDSGTVTLTVGSGDTTGPDVTIDQGASQADPTSTSPIVFDVVFSEPAYGFTGADVDLSSSTAGGTLVASVTSGVDGDTDYTVQVTGMTTSGDVIATIPADGATDLAGNGNTASTSTDNTVAWIEPGTVTALSAVHAWISLRNTDDIGTNFDLQVQFLKNGRIVASGLTRCITSVPRTPVEAIVNWDPSFSPFVVTSGDTLSITISARIGTNSDGSFCGGHSSATGLRVYWDSVSQPSHFDITVAPASSTDEYLHSNGTACTSAVSTGVTTLTFDSTAPTTSTGKCLDSGGLAFSGGNLFHTVNTWDMDVP